MVLKPIHVNIENELIKWLKIYCIEKNSNLNISKIINDLIRKFKEENS